LRALLADQRRGEAKKNNAVFVETTLKRGTSRRASLRAPSTEHRAGATYDAAASKSARFRKLRDDFVPAGVSRTFCFRKRTDDRRTAVADSALSSS
jgi:hypothetical protein